MGTWKTNQSLHNMVGSTNNSGGLAGAQELGEANKTNVIEISHYVKTDNHLHTIDSTMKSRLADKGAAVTETRPDGTHENAHKRGHAVFAPLVCGNKLPSKTACTL